MRPRRVRPIAYLLLSLPSAAFAQSGDAPNAQSYAAFRQTLIAEGWKPDVHYGLKLSSGKPLYRYPEVVCGPELCNAKWRNSQGDEKLVSLLRGYGSRDHRVAR